MSRSFINLSCGCMVSCDEGGGLLGKCNRDDCQFGIWLVRHQLCNICNECLNCDDHSGHTKMDGLDYIKSILGI